MIAFRRRDPIRHTDYRPTQGRRLRRFMWPTAIAVGVAFGACDSEPTGLEPVVVTLTITPSTIRLSSLGATSTLTVAAKEASGQDTDVGAVAWTSQDTTVATVSADGVATAVGNGTSDITALARGATATATLTVEQVVTAVVVAAPRDTLWSVGDTVRLAAEPQDSLGSPVDSAVATWASSDTTKTVVDADGLVTALAVGPTNITATAGGVTSDSTLMTVALSVDTVLVTQTTADFSAFAQTVTLGASVLDVNGAAVPGAVVTWVSATPAVATVDSSGVVTAVGNGTASITASSGGTTSESVTVTVSQVITSADITPAATTVIELGTLINFTATARDANGYAVAGSGPSTWTSATPGVGTIDTTGRATSVSDGTTVITASHAGFPATATLTVSQPALQMASSLSHTCIVDAQSRIQCWTDPSATPVVTTGGLTFRSVAVGFNTCAVTVTNDAYCWGAQDSVPVAVVGGLAFRSVSTAVWHSCGVTVSYEAYCWTVVDPTPALVPGGLAFQSISSGQGHNCAVTTANEVYCWGDNEYGGLGDGTGVNSTTPVLVSGALSALAVSAGTYGTCAVSTANDGYCWGVNLDGALGIGPTGGSFTPAAVAGGHKFQSIHFGDWLHSCGIIVGGGAYCWGNDSHWQLGDDLTSLPQFSPAPVAGGETFVTVGAGYLDSCGASATTVYCWGGALKGQSSYTTPVLSYAGLQQVVTGSKHSCGLTPANVAYCWGTGEAGQLGDGLNAHLSGPVAVSGGLAFQSLDAGGDATCGVTTANLLYCWGERGGSTPRLVVHDTTFQSVEWGSNHVCAVDARQDVLCWGVNSAGQLGDGTTTERIDPVRIVGVAGVNFLSVAAGGSHSCAVTTTNDMYCWGGNGSGELGIGTTVSSTTPVLVSGGHAFQVVTASVNTCGLTTANDAYCWGSGVSGMIGDGAQIQRETPTLVTGGHSFQAISSEFAHTCGLTTANLLYCWGQNTYGQVGDGTVVGKNSPTLVSGGLTFQSVSAGSNHSCAVTTTNDGMCWGQREFGQVKWDIIDFTPTVVTIVP